MRVLPFSKLMTAAEGVISAAHDRRLSRARCWSNIIRKQMGVCRQSRAYADRLRLQEVIDCFNASPDLPPTSVFA